MSRLPNRSYNTDYKADLLKEYKNSNKTYKEFAEEKDIPWRNLYDWINRSVRITTKPKSKKASFVPVNIKENPLATNNAMKISFPNGVELEVSEETNISIISSLIKLF